MKGGWEKIFGGMVIGGSLACLGQRRCFINIGGFINWMNEQIFA